MNTYNSTRHNTNREHNIHHIPYTNIHHTSQLQNSITHYLQQRPLPNKHSHIPPHNHYTIHKNNMHHIHTSIVSRHLATRGNNKILHTPPPHINVSEEIPPLFTHRTLAQLRTINHPFLNHKVDAKSHTSPLCPLCNTHTHDTHHLFSCTRKRTTLSPLALWTDPAGVTALVTR